VLRSCQQTSSLCQGLRTFLQAVQLAACGLLLHALLHSQEGLSQPLLKLA
jgi:hypothetical protein